MGFYTPTPFNYYYYYYYYRKEHVWCGPVASDAGSSNVFGARQSIVQDALQHNGSVIRRFADFRPTCHYRPKVPGPPSASHLRGLRVSRVNKTVVFIDADTDSWFLLIYFRNFISFSFLPSSTECDVVHGECVQTYVPYLFLVIPLGPVTLTGQDYVLVENGCVCRPKYARPVGQQESALSEILPGLNWIVLFFTSLANRLNAKSNPSVMDLASFALTTAHNVGKRQR